MNRTGAVLPRILLAFVIPVFCGCRSVRETNKKLPAKSAAACMTENPLCLTEQLDAPSCDETGGTPVSQTAAEQTPALCPAECAAAAPDLPRPWTVNLNNGSVRALVDGLLVYLYRPAAVLGDSVTAAPVDEQLILKPLFDAPTHPRVTGRQFRVFIDPGHGGEDPGAVFKSRGLTEKRITLDIARRLAFYLRGAGYAVRMSRDNDRASVALETRTDMAAHWNADVFVSIHANSSSSGNPEGIETYFLAHPGLPSTSMTNNGRFTETDLTMMKTRCDGNKNDDDNVRLAFAIHRRIMKTTGNTDRGMRSARFFVLRNAKMPAVLVECGYISSRSDSKRLRTADYKERCARGIYQGICDFASGRMSPGLTPNPTPNPKSKKNNNKTNFTDLSEPVWTPDYKLKPAPPESEIAKLRRKAAKSAGLPENTHETVTADH